jgi:hypothetical protein
MCASHVIETIPPADGAEDDSLFDMANLFPATTGLPMTVWVSPRGGARHDVRVKVNITHGNQMSVSNTAVVGVRPAPWLIEGRLDQQDQKAVFDWVAQNTEALVAYWDGQTDTAQLILALKRLG